MKLYGYWRSSCSYRVRIALNIKGLNYENIAVHLIREGGQQHQKTHHARNPKSEVPVLELDDGRHIAQSVAICEYLEETSPSPTLLPIDGYARARVRQLVEIVNAGIQPLQNLAVLTKLGEAGVEKSAWCRAVIERGFTALEQSAKNEAGDFLFANTLTLADVFLVPQVYNALRFGVNMSTYPTLLRANAHCIEQDAFKRAHPNNQPDAVAA